MIVACIQLNSGEDKAANVAAAVELVERAAGAGARLIVLPETWTYKGRAKGRAKASEPIDGRSNSVLAGLAREHRAYLLAGSIYERTPFPDRCGNASVLFGPNGRSLAVYRKIHLFDALAGTAVYRESDYLEAGQELVTAKVDGTIVGFSICYDLRFAELYRALALKGARILLVPSAFTAHTGQDHWEVLLRARAIENGCFVVAANQWGPHEPDRLCYGHSMIVDPWGTVLAEAPDEVDMCLADIDLAQVDAVRAQIPSLQHRRPELYGDWEV